MCLTKSNAPRLPNPKFSDRQLRFSSAASKKKSLQSAEQNQRARKGSSNIRFFNNWFEHQDKGQPFIAITVSNGERVVNNCPLIISKQQWILVKY